MLLKTNRIEILESSPRPVVLNADQHAKALADFTELERHYDYTLGINTDSSTILAWTNGWWMLGYPSMYLATGDAKYLNSVLYFAELLFRNRADRLGIVDTVRDRIIPAWSTDYYEVWLDEKWVKSPHCQCAHAGMILYPVVMVLYLVRRDPLLYAAHKDQVDRLLGLAIESATAFDDDWIEFPEENSANYRVIYQEKPGIYPHNCYAAMGRAFVALYLATGDDCWKIRAEKLARHLNERLERTSDGRILFHYKKAAGVYDALSYAAIVVEFMFMCHRAGIMFDEQDMRGIAQTLESIHSSEGFAWRIDGSDGAGRYGYEFNTTAAGWWLHYAWFMPELVELVTRRLDVKSNRKNLWTLALLAETSTEYQPFEPWQGCIEK